MADPGDTETVRASLHKPREFQLETCPPPRCGDGELLLAVEGCGVCASSLPLWQGRPWFDYPAPAGAPGHEAWGRVVDAAPQCDAGWLGQRVCCLAENAYASHLTVAADQVVALPPALDALPFPGEAAGCALNIYRRSDLSAGYAVVVVGGGFLGLALVQLAAADGIEVYLLSRRAGARELALEFGAREALPTGEWRQLLTPGHPGFPRVVEITGEQSGLDLAGELIAEYGKLIIAGYHQDGLRQVNMQQWNWRAIDVVNAHERDRRRQKTGMEMAVEAVAEGRLRLDSLLSHGLPMAQLNRAFDLLESRPAGFIKAWVAP